MKKPRGPEARFPKEGKHAPKIIQDAGWLLLIKESTKKRTTYYIKIPQYRTDNPVGFAVFNSAKFNSIWYAPHAGQVIPSNKRLKIAVIDLFDAARNKETSQYFYSTCGIPQYKWKFRDFESAEKLFALALLIWQNDSYLEDNE